jgi:hypothetical protein
LDCLRHGRYHIALTQAVGDLLNAGADEKALAEACDLLRGKVATSEPTVGDGCQPLVVDLLRRTGRMDEAVQEAKVFFLTSSDTTLQQAIQLVASTFKAADMNLVRANRFLRYQKSGPAGEDGKPGTPDDLTDVLAEIPPVADPARNALYEAGLKAVPATAAVYQQKSRLFLYLGRSVEAFEALKMGFVVCPPDQVQLQTATDAITGFVIRLTRDVTAAENIVKYIMYAEAGPDGAAGTADDIGNPLPGIEAKLKALAAPPATAAAQPAAPAN